MVNFLKHFFTPLENRSIYAGNGGNRKHQLLIEGGVKALLFLTGFTFNIKEVTLEEKFFKDALMRPPKGILLSLLDAPKFQSFYLRGIVSRLTFFPGFQDSKNGGGS
jgi:hypothetical protein